MKLNLNSLKEAEQAQNQKITKIDTTKLRAITETEPTTQTNSGRLNLNRLSFADEVKDNGVNEQGFKLTFTNGKTYDLDTMIYEKKRNNSSCPLILKVNLDNENDAKIIKDITILILTDYLEDYVPNDNYKNDILLVPDYSAVFDLYFNRYYTYYYNQYNKAQEGSISLSIDTIIEQINTYHENYINGILGDDESSLEANLYSANKPQVTYEYGTLPTFDSNTNDDVTDTDTNVPTTLVAVGNKLYLYHYNDELITQEPVEFKTINGVSLFGNGDLDIPSPITAENTIYLNETDYVDIAGLDPNITASSIFIHTEDEMILSPFESSDISMMEV